MMMGRLRAAAAAIVACALFLSSALVSAQTSTSISALPTGQPMTGTEWFPLSQQNASTGVYSTVKGSAAQISTYLIGNVTTLAHTWTGLQTFAVAPQYSTTTGFGTSVVNPGSGVLESVLPIQTVTGASKTFGTTDLFKKTRRSNSGSAMTDTLPASSATGMVNGARVDIANVDASAFDTLSPGAGTSIASGCSTVAAGRDVMLVYDLPNTTWRGDGNSCTVLLSANNLSDVANAATALSNLGGAPLASPAFTGAPTAPTPAGTDNSTKIATTALVAGNYVPQTRTVSAGAGLSGGGALSSNQTVSSSRIVNAQTGTTYAVQNSDQSKLDTFNNSSAVAVSIAQAGAGGNFAAGWEFDALNVGAGAVTITPTTSTINGATTFTLQTGQGAHIFTDGSNYFSQGGDGITLSGSVTAGHLASFVSKSQIQDAGGTGVASFNSRSGAVTPASGDYAIGQINNVNASTATMLGTAPNAAGGPAKFVSLPTQTTYTSGSGTYTVPANVLWLRVRVQGGGAGGGGGTTSGGNGTGGGASTFGSITANGGSAGLGGGAGGGGGTTSGGSTLNLTGAAGNAGGYSIASTIAATGGSGGASSFGGAGNGVANSPGGAAAANTGAGGAGGGNDSSLTSSAGGGGGAGGYSESLITSPSSTYAYAVGAGGAGGASAMHGGAGGAGAPGVIIIEEHYGQ